MLRSTHDSKSDFHGANPDHQNVLAEMLEKVLAYNISQIIRVRKKLSETEQMERTAA
jgi:hypothetical protein